MWVPRIEAMVAERPKVEEGRPCFPAKDSRSGACRRSMRVEMAASLSRCQRPGRQPGSRCQFHVPNPPWPDKLWIRDQSASGRLRHCRGGHARACGGQVNSALLSRRQARDLFDCSNLFRLDGLDRERLRLAFVVYGAMSRKDWRTVTPGDVGF